MSDEREEQQAKPLRIEFEFIQDASGRWGHRSRSDTGIPTSEVVLALELFKLSVLENQLQKMATHALRNQILQAKSIQH